FFSSRRRHTRFSRDWSSDVCSSDLDACPVVVEHIQQELVRERTGGDESPLGHLDERGLRGSDPDRQVPREIDRLEHEDRLVRGELDPDPDDFCFAISHADRVQLVRGRCWKIIRNFPICTSAPFCSSIESMSCRPTYVPLSDPVSRSVKPEGVRTNSACLRDTVTSSRKMSALGLRPTVTTSVSSRICAPASGPDTTTRSASVSSRFC